MRKEILKKGISMLMVNFPERSIDVETFWDLLSDLSDEQFIKAVKEILSNSVEINRASNIIAMIRQRACPVDKTEAGEAWGIVCREISRVGHYGVPKFSNATIAESVRCMGWRNLCISEEPGNDMARFRDTFNALKKRKNEEICTSPRVKELAQTVMKQLENHT